MGFFDVFNKKKKVKQSEKDNTLTKKIEINNLPTEVELGFKTGDYIQYKINGIKCKLEISASYKDDFELLTSDEIDELNWILKSNIINSEEVKKDILKYINVVYKSYENNFTERKSLGNEIKFSAINVGIKSKAVAFYGSAKCDEEHGISVSFKNREFACVNEETDFIS